MRRRRGLKQRSKSARNPNDLPPELLEIVGVEVCDFEYQADEDYTTYVVSTIVLYSTTYCTYCNTIYLTYIIYICMLSC